MSDPRGTSAERRLALLALLWLLTAAAAGLLFAWLLRPAPIREVVRIESPAVAADPGRSAGAPAAGPAGAAPRAAESSAPGSPSLAPTPAAGDPAVPGPEAAPAQASLRVAVVDAAGRPVEYGIVYALGPGEEGADDSGSLCSAEVAKDGTGLLRVPWAGTYDIGYNGEAGCVVAADVAVPAPGDAPLVLRIPGDAVVRARREPGGPAPSPEARILVHLESREGTVDHPGRGQAGPLASNFELDADGTGASAPLPGGRVFTVRGILREPLPGPTGNEGDAPVLQDSVRLRVEADRETVRPGETVGLHVRAAAALLVRARLDPVEFPDDGTVSFRVEVIQGARVQSFTCSSSGTLAKNRPLTGVWFRADPGPAVVRWSGGGIRRGEATDLVLAAEEAAVHTVILHPDPTGVPSVTPDSGPGLGGSPPPDRAVADPLRATLEGIPGMRGAWIFGVSRPGAVEQDLEEYAIDPDEKGPGGPGTVDLDPKWRTCAVVAAVSPPDLASDPVPVPPSGSVVLPLRPAGLLIVVPPFILQEGFGSLRLRLAGRRPIPVVEGEAGTRLDGVSLEVEARAGTLLGPLPEGTYVFEVRLGGIRLPDATAVVKAGRIEVLRIRR